MGRIAVLILIGACGRIHFDPVNDAFTQSDGAAGDAAPLPSGLVAWFTLDDTSAPSFVDSVAGNNGSCTPPACPVPTPGHIGQAFLFDGVDDCISITDVGQLQLANFTVGIWARQDAIAPLNGMSSVAKRVDVTASSDTWQIEDYSDNSLAFTSSYTTTSYNQLQAPANTIVVGMWQYLAVTWDGATKRLYVNGQLAAMGMIAGAINNDLHEAIIGCDDNMGAFTEWFAGALDDLQIYNRALSANELAQLAAR
jgi:hypothetical protein